jgi:hypothetical protein
MEPESSKAKNFLHAYVDGTAKFQLTLDGWARYQSLKTKRIESRKAFMAMKFGDPQLNAMVDKCFRPAVQRTGFELRMLTDRQRAGLIDDQIRSALLTARFVVADLTHGSLQHIGRQGLQTVAVCPLSTRAGVPNGTKQKPTLTLTI